MGQSFVGILAGGASAPLFGSPTSSEAANGPTKGVQQHGPYFVPRKLQATAEVGYV